VARLLGAEPSLHVADWLAVLEREEMIQRRRDGGPAAEAQYGFRHDLLREAAYRMLTDDDRQVGHRLAGQWLLEHGETDAVVLAEHFAGGGASEQAVDWFSKAAEAALARGQEGTEVADAIEALRKAATYYVRAGETCAASYANQAGVGFFERAVALWSSLDPVESSRARLRLAAVRERIGQRQEALEDLAVAEASADVPTLIEILLQRAELEVHAEEEGALERARRTAERARDLASSTGARQHEASAVLLLALSFGLEETEDSSRKAVQLAEMALRLQRGQGNLGKALMRLGNALLTRNDLDRSASLYRDAITAAGAVQDDLLIAQCLGNMAMVEYRRWHLDAAITSVERARALFGRVGHHRLEAIVTHNLGVFLQYRGDLERARDLHHELLEVAGSDWRIATACQQELADQERFRGAEARAQAWLTTAVRTSERVGVPRRTAVLMGFLAESYWASGDAKEAITTLEQAAELAGMTLSHALVLPQLGGQEDARPWLERFGLSEPEPDPYRRVAALLALARIRWERGEAAGGVELCDMALSILEPSPTPRVWVSVSALASSIRGEAEEAVHWLERARSETSPHAFTEAACDVGALLEHGADAELLRRYLGCVGPHQGIAYRVESLRAGVLEQLGETDDSDAARRRARELAAELSEQLEDDYRERFVRHAWVAALRPLRAV
jgi:tetratricopeptide (TPR) repeat protein